MSDERRPIALDVLALAALLGMAGDLLLRDGPIGVGAPLAALALAVGFGVLLRIRGLPLKNTARWLAVAPLLAAVLAWRSSEPLIPLTMLSVLLVLVCASLAAHARPIGRAGTWELISETAATGIHTAFAPFLLFVDMAGTGIRWPRWNTRGAAFARGALLAIPPLVLFGVLLMSADEAFAQIVSDLLYVDLEVLLSHVLLIGFFTWIAAGFLYWIILDDGRRVPRAEAIGIRLGTVEVSVVLGTLTVLFTAFVAIQSTYLFGGEARVLATTGLTYAEYARSGFFELVTVAFLLLPLLLLALWLVRDEPASNRLRIRVLAGVLMLLAFLLMGSALYRMRLYQEAYGLTHLRFYTTAFMAWLAVVFLVFAGTVLRGRPARFAAGVVGSALVAVLTVAVLNPDARIAETNLERARAGADFDAAHVRAELGADAVPALMAALDQLPPDDRCVIAAWLLERWGTDASRQDSWRTWNLARDRARGLVRGNEPALRELACPQTA